MTIPYVVVQVAASLDGRISVGPNRTMFEDLSDSRAAVPNDGAVWTKVERELYEIHQPQVDMLGSNSLVKEGDELTKLPHYTGDEASLYQDYLPEEVINRPNHEGWLAVVDGRGRCRSGYRGEGDLAKHMLHLVSHGVSAEYLSFLQHKKIPYLISGGSRVDLTEALQKLRAKLGVTHLVTTAGGKLAGALLRQNLVDEVNVVVRPVIIGGFDTPSLFDSPELREDEQATRVSLLSTQVLEGGYVWLRYRVDR